MNIGLLWFDDSSSRSFEEKVRRAVRRYVQKFGCEPDVCYVHPSTARGELRSVAQVKIAPLVSIPRDHFFVCLAAEARLPRARKPATR